MPNVGDFCSLLKVEKIDTWTVASSVSGHGWQERLGLREVDVDPGDVGDDVGRPEGIVFDIFHLKINGTDEARCGVQENDNFVQLGLNEADTFESWAQCYKSFLSVIYGFS